MKNLILIGASGGIGRAIYDELKESYHIIATANEHYYDLKNSIANIELYKLDLASKPSLDEFVYNINKRYRYIDAIVFASGFSDINMINRQDDDIITKILDINLNAPIILTHLLVDKLLALSGIRESSLIYISSIWGISGASCEAVYSASKAGLINFSNALAKELGPSGVRVNSISPGVIDTRMNFNINLEDKLNLTKEIPLGRMARASEIASVVKFLLEDASYVSGANIKIDGGFL